MARSRTTAGLHHAIAPDFFTQVGIREDPLNGLSQHGNVTIRHDQRGLSVFHKVEPPASRETNHCATARHGFKRRQGESFRETKRNENIRLLIGFNHLMLRLVMRQNDRMQGSPQVGRKPPQSLIAQNPCRLASEIKQTARSPVCRLGLEFLQIDSVADQPYRQRGVCFHPVFQVAAAAHNSRESEIGVIPAPDGIFHKPPVLDKSQLAAA